jgi:hypothetical protein
VAGFERLVAEAMAKAETRQEKAILNRVAQRLAVADGNALTRDVWGGCNDLKPEDYYHPRSGFSPG